jgi:hypothetical protein
MMRHAAAVAMVAAFLRVQHVLISWKLRDDAGHPATLKRVFVRIVCPTGTDFTTTYAKSIAPGLYSRG